MNQKALELNLMNTTFADPSGLSAGNVSSVGDLFQLVNYIYKQKPFIFDVTAKRNSFGLQPNDEFGELLNFNQFGDQDYFVGGKVGETIAAKQTSVSLHNLKIGGQERVLALILLGSEDRTADIETLLAFVAEQYGR